MEISKIGLPKNSTTSLINTNGCNNSKPKFGNSDSSDKLELSNDKQEPKSSNTAKKWGVGIASFCVAGLGQLINGETSKAFAFFAGSLATGALGILALRVNKALGVLLCLGSSAISIWSIVDAVKNVKSPNE